MRCIGKQRGALTQRSTLGASAQCELTPAWRTGLTRRVGLTRGAQGRQDKIIINRWTWMGTSRRPSAYFVGKNEIFSWINSTLQLSLAKVEEAASDAVQCQMMDMFHPGVVPMHKALLAHLLKKYQQLRRCITANSFFVLNML